MKSDLYSFILRGLLTNTALDETPRIWRHEASTVLEKEITTKLPYKQLDERHITNAKRMATIFVAISAFENTMRDFIERIMVDAVGPDWWAEKAPQKLKGKVDARISKEQKIPWHTPRGGKSLNYTDFGDLADLMAALWEHFDQDVRDQDRLRTTFNVIELSRNACMHGGDISERDIERVGMLMRDWLDQLGLG